MSLIHKKASSFRFSRFRRFLFSLFLDRRSFFLCSLLSCLCFIQSIIIYKVLFSSSKKLPIILVSHSSGDVDVLDARIFQPSSSNIAYFIRIWVSRLLSVDIRHIRSDLSGASSWVRGQAVDEFYHFVKTNLSGKNWDSEYSQLVVFHSLVLGGKKSSRYADLTFSIKIKKAGHLLEEKEKMMHIDFLLVPPSSEKEARDNPIGLFITHFFVSSANFTGSNF